MEETINTRLRSERKRVGMTQQELAIEGGVSLNSQQKYENTNRKPDAEYLSNIWSVANVPFILTGKSNRNLSIEDESPEYRGTKNLRSFDYDELGFSDQLDLMLNASDNYEKIVNSIDPPKPNSSAYKDVRSFVAFTHLTERGIFQLLELLKKARNDNFWVDK